MGLVFKQLAILLWKGWVMRRCHWISTIFELLFPILMALIIAYFYNSYSNERPRYYSGSLRGEGWLGPVYYPDVNHYKLDGLFEQSKNFFYTPVTDFTRQLMATLQKKFPNVTAIPIDTESQLLVYLINDTSRYYYSSYGTRIGLVLTGSTPAALNLTIRIRDYYLRYAARVIYATKYRTGPASAYGYDGSAKAYDPYDPYPDQRDRWYQQYGIFTQTQIAATEAFFDYLCNEKGIDRSERNAVVSEVAPQEIPFPMYYRPPNSDMFNAMFGVSIVLITGYLVVCPLMVKRITDEKACKAKEMLRMMGMSDWVFWLSHFINHLSVMAVQSGIITVLLVYGYGKGTAVKWSNGWLVYFSMLIYNASSILSSMLLTVVFGRPVTAVVMSVILFELSYAGPLGLLDPTFRGINSMSYESRTIWVAVTALLPNAGLHWFLTVVGSAESYGRGLLWTDLWNPSMSFMDLTAGYVMLLQFISIFIYMILIWYVDNVWPFQYGIPKPIYYPLLPSYWLPHWSARASRSVQTFEFKDYITDGTHFEHEPTFKVGIECQHLHKRFHKKIAVSDVTFNIYKGQITVLLGHNGAGKTTTMNMITGIFPPTSGDVLVGEYSVRLQTKQARMSLALCPQENVLYNELSCAEHLRLYAALKDHPWSDVDHEVEKILSMVDLVEKRDAMSSALSGGMKRKLCLGIAMVADSKILVLDEPTSGMDPEARRRIWDTLQAVREERTILLTTHYMEEADTLGDRIVIMSEGVVKCSGSPLFLKKTFGAGYHLRLQRNDKFDRKRTMALIRSVIPEAVVKSEIQSEIIVGLEGQDRGQDISKRLPVLFNQLEPSKHSLGIDSCGLTVTTMEDVFLKVGNEYNDTRHGQSNQEADSTVIQCIPQYTGSRLLRQQMLALFLKRCHFAKRHWSMLTKQIGVSALLFTGLLLLDNCIKNVVSDRDVDRELDMNMYGPTIGFYKSVTEARFGQTYQDVSAGQQVSTRLLDTKESPANWTLAQGGNDLSTYIRTYLVGGQIESNTSGLELKPWYNREATHSMPCSLNLLYQTLMRTVVGNVTITVHNYPAPFTYYYQSSVHSVTYTMIYTCFLFVPLTVPFLAASYVLFPVHERLSKSKLLQLMTGTPTWAFWTASYLFDLLNHLVATLVIFVVFAIFDKKKVFIDNDLSRTGLFLTLMSLGCSSIPLAYLFSLKFKRPNSAYAVLVIIYLVTGLILMLALGLIGQALVPHKLSKSAHDILTGFARLLPVYSMSMAFQKLYKLGSYRWACAEMDPVLLDYQCSSTDLKVYDELYGCCKAKCAEQHLCYDQFNALGWSELGVAQEVTYLLCTGLVLWLWLLFIEAYSSGISYWWQSLTTQHTDMDNKSVSVDGQSANGQLYNGHLTPMPKTPQSAEDSDVSEERQRIESLVGQQNHKNEALVVNDLHKTFGRLTPIRAVNGLTFGVHREEVFGLLGVNGAGKTTTFRMLTGDETVSSGDAWSDGQSLMSDLRSFQTRIGYCPQFDALLDKMTGRETLYLFCRLRGMPSDMISAYVSDLVAMVDLVKHVDKCTETYSGGNRRKLSLAIALCAAPPIIFLDEPTAGVDPSARRKIWSTLAHLRQRYGSAFVLTSHSMEECEALCQRVAILVNGQFQCLGSVQHLRHKFGQGFTIQAKIKPEFAEDMEYMEKLVIHFNQVLPSAVLKDVHQGLIHYHVTDTSVLWSKMFEVMEGMKMKYFLEDYVISDTTLEQIFLSFARRQRTIDINVT